MKRRDDVTRIVLPLVVITAFCISAIGQTQKVVLTQSVSGDWKAVETAIGKTGSLQPGDVFKIGLPRTDLAVTVRGVSINPALALGSWVAFKKMGSETVVMGEDRKS